MSDTDSLSRRDAAVIWHPFTQHGRGNPLLQISGASGATLRGTDGTAYLDMISSWWVNLHGHGRAELARAVAEQVLRLDHVQFAGTTHEPAVRLAERLLEQASLRGSSKVFYSDNGSTAVEVALKIAHQHWANRGEPRTLFATLHGGYHGDTSGAMSVGRSSGFFDSFRNMMFRTVALPVPLIWNGSENQADEAEALERATALMKSSSRQIAALIVEPLVQGAGGMRFHSPHFLRQLCLLFREHSIPVIFDEVMTGFGRTGSFFAFQQTGFLPDLICLSKGITGGILPLAATIASDALFDSFLGNDFATALAHGHSYTANPVSCAAALASMDLHMTTDSAAQVARINRRMASRLEILSDHPKVTHPRLIGGIAAFDLVGEDLGYAAGSGANLAAFARENGVLIRPLGNVVYLMPPYCTTDMEIDIAFDVIGAFLDS